MVGRCEDDVVAAFQAEPFTVRVSDEVLADLRARIGNTRWPGPAPGVPWAQGTDLAYLRDLAAYWAGTFDWRAQERWLNSFSHFRAEIDGIGVRRGHPVPARLRVLRPAAPDRGDEPVYRRAVASADAGPGLPPLRRAGQRFRVRGDDLHGPGRPGAHAGHPSVQPGYRAVHRAGLAAAVRGGTFLPGAVPVVAV